MLKKLTLELPVGKSKAAGLFLSPGWCRIGNQFWEFPEILRRGCELELFICTFWSTKPHHRGAHVSLQVRKEHRDFPPLNERGHGGICFADVARDVSGRFVD